MDVTIKRKKHDSIKISRVSLLKGEFVYNPLGRSNFFHGETSHKVTRQIINIHLPMINFCNIFGKLYPGRYFPLVTLFLIVSVTENPTHDKF